MPAERTNILPIEDNPVDALCARSILSGDEQFSAQLECVDCLVSGLDLFKEDPYRKRQSTDLELQCSRNGSPGRLDQRKMRDSHSVCVECIDEEFKGILALKCAGSGDGEEPCR